jgi:putative hydrolase of the HAD superfamily
MTCDDFVTVGDERPKNARQHLIFDADDTLWHNNIHFERATEEFIDFLDHSTLDRVQVRAALDEIERVNAVKHGYGSRSFAISLHECYIHLAERDIDPTDIDVIMGFGERILTATMDLVDGVEEVVAQLATRHELIILTKGQHDEQRMKIERSGLERYFTHAEITPEKHVGTYRTLVDARFFDPIRTWMIGNSPKSDINPALAAGLNAVFVPHDMTWRLEHAEIADPGGPGRLLVVDRIRDLLEHF